MDSRGSTARRVHALVALPPPINGQSTANSFLVGALDNDARLSVSLLDTGPGQLRRGPRYHWTRVRRVGRALVHIALRARRGDAVYFVLESGLGRIYNVFIAVAARLVGCQPVLHHHTAAHVLHQDPFFAGFCRLLGAKSSHVVLSAQMSAQLLGRYSLPGAVRTLHNAALISAPASLERPQRRGPVRLGFLSNLSDEKGLDVCLSTFRLLRAEGIEAILSLAGPAADPSAEVTISNAAKEFGDRLEVLGPVAGANKQAFLLSTDIFLFPSRYRYEAQPLVVLEAMAHGCIPVVSHAGFTAELLGDGSPPATSLDSFPEIALEICRAIMNSGQTLHTMSAAARSRYIELRDLSERELDLFIDDFAQGRTRAPPANLAARTFAINSGDLGR
jgi:glycosyltransferase involved in cell wall biosynthesis